MLKSIKDIAYTVYSVVKGLTVTIINFFRRKVTLQYPEQRWSLPDNYRGIPALPVNPKTGADKCIACGACARICPEQIITVTSEMGEDKKRKLIDFTIDASRCMWCGLCTEVCPTNALVMSKEYELAVDSREAMVFHLEDMHRHGGAFPEEPEPEPEAENEATEPPGDKPVGESEEGAKQES